MPEYLAPGVFVEEIPTSNKPIQAASTSTAGMVGMTARGPVNTPTLVSSLGAYNRIFGGDLNPLVFLDGRDALPYAAAGFFANGGARLYVVRIVGDAAEASERALFAADSSVAASPILAAPAAEGDTSLALADVGAAAAGTQLLLEDGEASEPVTIAAGTPEPRLQIGGGLRHTYSDGDAVTLQAPTPVVGVQLTADAAAGATTLTVDASAALTAGTTYLLQPAGAGETELITIDALATATTVTVQAPLRATHASGSTFSTLADSTEVAVVGDVAASAARVLIAVDDPAGLDPGDVLKLENGTDEELVTVSGLAQVVGLNAPLTANHPANSSLTPAVEVLTVHARYPGAWGDSLRIAAGAASTPLLNTEITSTEGAASQTVEVSTAFGLFAGSIVVIDDRLVREVATVDTTDGIVTLTEPHGESLTPGMTLVSREFSLTVERIEDGRVVEAETFDKLCLTPGHPRYALTRVGSWNGGAVSASGGSNLIRLEDQVTDAAARRLAMVPGVPGFLDGGDDDVAGVGEATYVGEAAEDPGARTGMQALENESTLSIVAVPGQTSITVQKALVDHCERMRYRFAVLDTPIGANLQEARAHRQNFDTTCAAVYYPALEIADRFGAPGERRIIPPAGHILGVYVRTDVARGVHKAPANEVVRGILSFDQKLDKAAQEILNPINLNCLRDFRSENRGLRVYGARVATSDPEWRYVNVRRLFLFIEQSLDTGLQWAVFEPNSEALWATVKQSVTNFLTTVWRSGALEGTVPEEAFFVNVGYDITMTQDDVDSGRLVIEIGAAPVKPAEFVILRISQKTREATS